MAEFITPKTDWIAEDYINVSDYNRILNNVWYLGTSRLNEYYNIEGFDDIYDPAAETDYPTADRWNLIEEKLDYLDTITGNLVSIGDRKYFYPGGQYIDYNELNRIENLTQKLYDLYERIKRTEVRLPFTLGDEGGF